MRRLYTKRVSREDAGQAVYAKRNDWTNGKEWIYREKQDEKDSRKAEFILLRREEVSVKTVIKKFVMIQEKLQEYFTKEEQEELKRLLNKFCDCLDEQTEILKKERKEKSDA